MSENILGNNIKKLRELKDINQKELASFLNISNTTLSQYESGKRTPSDDVKSKIADFFNVSIDYLLGKTNIKEPADKMFKEDSTIAFHRTDGYEEDLPPEAIEEIEKFKEFIRHKYGKK